ncbi:MAG: PKD domain-containing protein, partial [Desulfobacteraceae bacterium]|nr:PKD domain-containing protein [Desulfobacteraceae bacterium]
MNNRLIYYLAICLILLLNVALPQNTNAETGHLYHVNPAYKQLAAGKRAPLNKGLAKRSKTVTTCSSYDSFADVLDGYIQGHNTSFQIALQYDFLFFQVEDIINRAIDEVFDGDDYLALSYVSYSSSWSGDNGSVTITFTFDFLTTADEEEEITQRLQEIMFSFSGIIIPGMNNEEMGKEIHDWIVLNVAYDMSLTEHSAHAALFLGTTVCQGYSLLMTRMLSEVNIESKIVVSESMNHAWNLVNLCDTWYHVDATWDDPVPDTTGYVRYDYYNLSDSEMGQDHTFSGGYPACPYSYIEGDCGTSANPDPLIISAQSDTASGNAPLNINLGVTVESGASPYTFQWNFGDGTPGSSQQNPEHTYFDAGTYTAEVTVTDDNG